MTDADPGAATVAALFDPEPETWGLRGDPYLWRAMRGHLAETLLPGSAGELTGLLHTAFRDLTGVDLATSPASMAYREQYACGGMSSGMISLDAWRERLLPLLIERANGSHLRTLWPTWPTGQELVPSHPGRGG